MSGKRTTEGHFWGSETSTPGVMGQLTQPSPINLVYDFPNILEWRVVLDTGHRTPDPLSSSEVFNFPPSYCLWFTTETYTGQALPQKHPSPCLLNPSAILCRMQTSASESWLWGAHLEWTSWCTDGRRFRLSTSGAALPHGRFQNITLVTPLYRQSWKSLLYKSLSSQITGETNNY